MKKRVSSVEPTHVSVINRQHIVPVKSAAIRAQAATFLDKAAQRKRLRWKEVSVVLVDDQESRAINRSALGHNYPTDVISFNFDPIPGEDSCSLTGEIVVNVEMAKRLGHRYGGTLRELALYIAHGCDHLSGEDDAMPAQRMRMRRRELRWLAEIL